MLLAIELTALDTELEERELLATDDGSDEDITTDDTLDDEGATEEGADDESAIDEGAEDEGAIDEGAEEERSEDRLEDRADELGRLLLGALLDCGVELVPPTIPHGEGCAAQVERDIQLLLFS